MKPETQIKIGQRTAWILFALHLLLIKIRNILEYEKPDYFPSLVLPILLGSYIFAVRRRLFRLSLFLFSGITITYLYFAYIMYFFINPAKTFIYLIFIILLSQSVFGMYREKRMALATKGEQKQ